MDNKSWPFVVNACLLTPEKSNRPLCTWKGLGFLLLSLCLSYLMIFIDLLFFTSYSSCTVCNSFPICHKFIGLDNHNQDQITYISIKLIRGNRKIFFSRAFWRNHFGTGRKDSWRIWQIDVCAKIYHGITSCQFASITMRANIFAAYFWKICQNIFATSLQKM